MVNSKLNSFLKLGLLMGIKESYLLTRNTYGLYRHPFLTTKRIVQERDLSQGILVFGLPFYLWLGWVLVLIVSRIFFFQRLLFGFWAKSSFLFISFFVSLLFLFLGYWVFRVLKRERRGE